MSSTVLTDLRYAFRGLVSRPLFTLVAIASLALGIGVNTAIYSLFAQVVLQPLPVSAPQQLANLSAPGRKSGSTSNNSQGPRDDILSYPMLRDLQRAAPSDAIVGIAGHRAQPVNISAGGGTRSGTAMLVTGNYFPLLGVGSARGRLLGAQDDTTPGADRVAVLSHHFWQDVLGADPGVIGQGITVNGQSLEIVGVAAAGFSGTSFGSRADVFVPITLRWAIQGSVAATPEQRKDYWVYAFARLAPAVSIADAQAALAAPYQVLLREVELPLHPEFDEATRAEFGARELRLSDGRQGQSSASGNAAKPLGMLFGIALLVLAVACMNIANLMLARGAGRVAEFALRASIGASRVRLLRQLLTEALLLAIAGVLAALPVAAIAMRGLVSWMPNTDGFDPQLDAGALGFALTAAVSAALLFGLFPALQLARVAPALALRGESGQAGSRGGNRFRNGLATAQIAFSMASLVLAGLFLQSLANIGREDLGMQVDSLAVFTVSPGRSGYDTEHSAAVYQRIADALRELPTTSHVASSMVPLLSNNDWGTNLSIEGRDNSDADASSSMYNLVGDDYFAALGIAVLTGRAFEPADAGSGRPKVAVVNRRFVEQFGLKQPVGTRMAIGQQDELDIEIVGVVADSKYSDPRQVAPALFYLAHAQHPAQGSMSFYVRSPLRPESLLAQLPAVVAAIDPDLPVQGVRTLRQQIEETLVTERFVGLLSAAFALLSTLLAALGLYGVLSYTLSQRMREIGLRLALGAAPARVSRMLIRQVTRMTVVGVLIGLATALAAGRAAQSLLFGLESHDPRVLGAALLLLVLVALASGWLPARRAGRIDPMTALRHD